MDSYSNLTESHHEDRDPILASDGKGFFFLTEAFGTFNVAYKPFDGEAEALTNFSLHPVRSLSASKSETLCFLFDGEIYTLQPGGSAAKVAVEIRHDQPLALSTHDFSSGATEIAVAPNGKEIALVYRGDVFVTSVETGTTRQVTQTPEQERHISFSSDGKFIVYASERGSWNLYRSQKAYSEPYFYVATGFTEETVYESENDSFQPAFSPDGEEVAFIDQRTALKVVNLESKEVRTIMPLEQSFSYADGDQHFEWSPDGKWFFVNFLKPNYWIPQIGLISSDGKGVMHNISQSGYGAFAPRWMMKGDMCLFFSSRDGLRAHAKSGSAQSDVYALFMNQKAYDRFSLSEEDFKLLKEKEDESKEKEDKDKAESKKDKDKKDEEKPETEPIKIQLDGLEERYARLTIHSASMSGAAVTPDGEKLYYLARFEKGFDLWETELRTQKTKLVEKLGARGGQLVMDSEGKNLFILASGKISQYDIGKSKMKTISYSGKVEVDENAERAYFFEHVWRQVKAKFYKTDLHGAKWEMLGDAYRRFLPHIRNNYDFQVLLSELLGELNASHTGARYRPSRTVQTASLGLLYDWSQQGLVVAEVLEKGPFDRVDSALKSGDRIMVIDGHKVGEGNIWKALKDKVGTKIRISFQSADGTRKWDEVIKPISPGAESELLYQRWVKSRREETERLSGGKLGYVHVRGMNDSSYRTVISEVLGRHSQKEGLVVDTRFNGGGDLVDDLCNFLSGKKYMDFLTADGRRIGMEPTNRWTKPSIVIASQGNYSDAHCFPWAYKELGIGKVVGMPVPGTCTFVWWELLHNREIVFGIPNLGIEAPDGSILENTQLEMDVQVENDWSEVIKGRDQQLETAIKSLLETPLK